MYIYIYKYTYSRGSRQSAYPLLAQDYRLKVAGHAKGTCAQCQLFDCLIDTISGGAIVRCRFTRLLSCS